MTGENVYLLQVWAVKYVAGGLLCADLEEGSNMHINKETCRVEDKWCPVYDLQFSLHKPLATGKIRPGII